MTTAPKVRPRDWHPLAESDPVPGDPEEIRSEVKRMKGVASSLREQARLLRGIGNDDELKGKYANSLRDESEGLEKKLREVAERYENVHGYLTRWAGELEGFQTQADKVLANAKRAQEEADADKKKAVTNKPGPGEPSPSPSGTDHDPLTEYRLQLNRITSERDERASHYADKIRDELDDSIEDSFWDDAKGWLHDNADLFKTIGDLVGDLSGILGMLAIITMPFPPLGAIFATAAAVTSGIALISHLLAKAGGADVSWFSMGLEALGAIPGITAFAKGVKVADGAVAAARATQLGSGFRGVTTIGRNIVGIGDNVAGAASFTVKGKTIGLWGLKHNGLIKAEGLMGRMTLVAEQTVHNGQWIGTRGLSLASRGRWSIDPMSNLGRGIDAGLKIAPKLVSIPTHVGELINPGDRFQESVAS
ncbi:putative T7SS-secreted protein [Streptomyces sp. NPDC007991]|uniref:putative T7SS-secreted protein n=1 Tax=Streptomyces sp. NPDC007991 TaxID=3364803 RepID=UPI0036E30043